MVPEHATLVGAAGASSVRVGVSPPDEAAGDDRPIQSRSGVVTNMTQDEQPNICVLIDFENMAVSAEQVDQEFDLTPVMELLKTRGRLAIRRAYGDWARIGISALTS